MTPPDPPPGWVAWAPPLDPPTSGGLPYATAEEIAEATNWPASPHLTAALQWEAYAASMPATAPVSSVSTGSQTVTYAGGAGGAFSAAWGRAEWHRSFLGDLISVPLGLDYDVVLPAFPGCWPIIAQDYSR